MSLRVKITKSPAESKMEDSKSPWGIFCYISTFSRTMRISAPDEAFRIGCQPAAQVCGTGHFPYARQATSIADDDQRNTKILVLGGGLKAGSSISSMKPVSVVGFKMKVEWRLECSAWVTSTKIEVRPLAESALLVSP